MLLAWRYPYISLPLTIAYLARASLALVHYYVAPLPTGISDAVFFENVAWTWARDGIAATLANFPGVDTYFYSWLLALSYALTERSPLMGQSVNVLAGVWAVFLTWLLAKNISDGQYARRAAWCMALFPTAIMYSVVTLRESFIVLFLLLGLLNVVKWARFNRMNSAAWALAAFTAAGFMHGGMFIAIIVFIGLFFFREAKTLRVKVTHGRPSGKSILIICMIIATTLSGAVFLTSGVSLPKIGDPSDLTRSERWVEVMSHYPDAPAKYPDWTEPSAAADLLWAVPVRLLYYAFSPFPWDVSEAHHLIGIIDSVFYMTLAFVILRHFREIWRDPAGRSILLILLPLLAAFAIGTGNFGTAMRHRAKFVAALVVLVAFKLPGLTLKRKRY